MSDHEIPPAQPPQPAEPVDAVAQQAANPVAAVEPSIPRGAWRVLVANQAQRLEDELVELKTAPGQLTLECAALIERCLRRAREALVRPQSVPERIRDWSSGARPEIAWGALHEAGQLIFEHQPPETVFAQVPEVAASVASNLKDGDPRKINYLKILAAAEAKEPGEISNNDQASIARIRRTSDSASDAAHGNVRGYRNLLLALGIGLMIVVATMAILHAIIPSFLDFGAHHGSDAPEIWAIEVAGFFGGSIAAVLALSRLETVTGPYSLSGYQALLRVPMAGAVSLFGILLLQSNSLGALKPVYGLELYAYAIFFGYAQEPLLRMIDKRAATVLESARSKDDPAGSASTSNA
jgi:hypothetical protein